MNLEAVLKVCAHKSMILDVRIQKIASVLAGS